MIVEEGLCPKRKSARTRPAIAMQEKAATTVLRIARPPARHRRCNVPVVILNVFNSQNCSQSSRQRSCDLLTEP